MLTLQPPEPLRNLRPRRLLLFATFVTLLSTGVAFDASPSGAGIITTFAGGGPADGTLATTAGIPRPYGLARDNSGNLYIGSFDTGRVYKMDPGGQLSVVLGIDGTERGVSGLAVDAGGNLLVADIYNRIRRVNAVTGIITTIAGNQGQGFGGDGGPAIDATLNSPRGVAVDDDGNIFIADSQNHRIRKVNTSGIITTVAGVGTAGYNGDGISATSAQLNYPEDVAVDHAGNIFIADTFNRLIRKVDAFTGLISSISGAPTFTSGTPAGVAVDSAGNVFFTNGFPSEGIGRIDATTGALTFPAGSGIRGFFGDGAPATTASFDFSFHSGLVVDDAGNIFVADTNNFRVRKVSAPGLFDPTRFISTVAGNGTPGDGQPAPTAILASPERVAVDNAGNVFIADYGQQRVRRVDAQTGVMSTVAGGGYGADGSLAVDAALSETLGLAVDASGNIFVGDTGRVRRVNAATGVITTVAGGGGFGGFAGDGGPATSATLNYGWLDVAVDTIGNLYITDESNHRIRKVDAATQVITTVAGNGVPGFAGDGMSASFASLNSPQGLVVDAAGDLYIADTGNNRIRRVDSLTGVINTVAGNGSFGFGGDGDLATNASLGFPTGVAVDRLGNLFIAEYGMQRVRRVDVSSGIIVTVAGNGACCFSGDGGPSLSAALSGPHGIALNTSGDLFIADIYSGRVRQVSLRAFASLSGTGLSFGDQPTGTTSAAQTITLRNTGTAALTISSIDVSADFTQTNTCGTSVASGASCVFEVSFSPAVAGVRHGTVTIHDDAFDGAQVINLSGGVGAAPTVTVTGGPFIYDGGQHPALVSVTGVGGLPITGTTTVLYTPGGPSAPVNAGTYAVNVTFTSADPGYADATGGGVITVLKAAPAIFWATPADIVPGTALSGVQLNATANTFGSFAYTPPAGTVLLAGNGQILSVTFTPDDLTNYTTAVASVLINVTPPGLRYLTIEQPQSFSSQVIRGSGLPANASCSLTTGDELMAFFSTSPSGDFAFNFGIYQEIVLPRTVTLDCDAGLFVGNQIATSGPVPMSPFGTVTFDPLVSNASAIIRGAGLPPSCELFLLSYVTGSNVRLFGGGSTQEDGTFAFNFNFPSAAQTASEYRWTPQFACSGPALSGVNPGGPYPRTVILAPLKTTPIVTWNTPADIVTGTPLSSVQLNATANVPGTFAYTPPAGTVLPTGNGQTLSVTFTPADTATFATVTKTVTINVATTVVFWNNPANILVGTPLSSIQLNATANTPGVFVYSPPAGTILPLGNGRILSVTFTPNDPVNYSTVTKRVTINVTSSAGMFGGRVTDAAT